MIDNRNDLPSPSAPNFNQRLRETIQTYLGRQGNPLDRGLTLRDLTETGLLKLRDGFTLKPGSGSSTLPLEPGPGLADEPDLTPPPTPTGLTATAAISHIIIEHDAPIYTQGRGHLRTRLYGKIVNTGDPLPTFADAVEIAQFDGSVYAHPSNPATTWRFWIKWETIDNVLSIDPAGGTNGVEAITGQDVSKLVKAMTGPGNPFKVVTEELTLPDGTVVPTGTYTADAFIHNGQITNAKIANLAVDSAKIASVSADKITAGSIAVGQHIQSAGYVAGSSGWRINGDGSAEFSNATVRGTVYATDGQFWGTLLGGAATSYSSGMGFYAGGGTTSNGSEYRWRVGSPTGARIQWNGSAVEVYNASNQLTITSGGISASFVTGLGDFATLDQITSANISTYIAGAAIGTAHIADAAITQAKIGTAAVGSAQIDSAAVGSAHISDAAITNAKISDAAITNAKIGNAAVDTLQLAGQAVTIPTSAYTDGSIVASYGSTITIQQVSFTSSGAPVYISYDFYATATGFNQANVTLSLTVYRNSTLIRSLSAAEGSAISEYISGSFTDVPNAGNVTYYLKVAATSVNSVSATLSKRSLFTLETKR